MRYLFYAGSFYEHIVQNAEIIKS